MPGGLGGRVRWAPYGSAPPLRDLGVTSAPMVKPLYVHYFFQKSRSHAAWRSNRLAPPMRHFRSRVGFSNVWGFSRIFRVASLALSRFVFRYIRGRPFLDLKFCFLGLTLWCFLSQYAALCFLHFLASPWIAYWLVGSGRARLTVYG